MLAQWIEKHTALISGEPWVIERHPVRAVMCADFVAERTLWACAFKGDSLSRSPLLAALHPMLNTAICP